MLRNNGCARSTNRRIDALLLFLHVIGTINSFNSSLNCIIPFVSHPSNMYILAHCGVTGAIHRSVQFPPFQVEHASFSDRIGCSVDPGYLVEGVKRGPSGKEEEVRKKYSHVLRLRSGDWCHKETVLFFSKDTMNRNWFVALFPWEINPSLSRGSFVAYFQIYFGCQVCGGYAQTRPLHLPEASVPTYGRAYWVKNPLLSECQECLVD